MKSRINKVHPLITKRRSIVSFSPEIPSTDDLILLFEAARWAPSSRNQQPWRFIYSTREEEEVYMRFFNLLDEGNQKWAQSAPVLALSIAETISEYKNRSNRFAMHDLGMAMGNLLVQATAMGLYVHQMGGYDADMARRVFQIPERFEPAAMMAIGFRGEIDHLPMDLKRRELQKRSRKELEEFVFWGGWKG